MSALVAVAPVVLPPLQAAVPLTTLTAAVTALVGGFVAYQAYRGYRRNDSRPMLFLGLGILLLTAVPFALRVSLGAVVGTEASALAAQTSRVGGLLAVLYSFTGP